MLSKLICAITLLASTAHSATFGNHSAYGGNYVIRDNVAITPASPDQSGVCDSVTAYLKPSFDSCKARCALYIVSGNDTILVPNGVTEERRFAPATGFAWYVFPFPSPRPMVTAGASYFIATFGDSAGTTGTGLPRSGVGGGIAPVISKNADYESGFPAQLNPTTSSTTLTMSAYVTYTPVSSIPPRRRRIATRPCPSP